MSHQNEIFHFVIFLQNRNVVHTSVLIWWIICSAMRRREAFQTITHPYWVDGNIISFSLVHGIAKENKFYFVIILYDRRNTDILLSLNALKSQISNHTVKDISVFHHCGNGILFSSHLSRPVGAMYRG